MTPDFILNPSCCSENSVLLPMSEAGQLWLEENVPVRQRMTKNLLVLAPADVMPLIQSLTAEGYTVKQ